MPKLQNDKGDYIFYELIPGDLAKPYLIYLHEGLGCTAMWRDFPKTLCSITGCPGLVYDRLGYGNSSPWDCNYRRAVHYLHEYALQELPWMLENVTTDAPFILIGHSDGGSINLIFGAEKPPLLQGIITEAAHVSVEQETLVGIRRAVAAWEQGKLKGLGKHHKDKSETVFRTWSETWLSPWFKQWNIKDLLPEIDVPLLVIQGENDQYASAAQAKYLASSTSGEVKLEIIKNCAHVPHHEAQPVVLNLMSDFIAQLCQK